MLLCEPCQVWFLDAVQRCFVNERGLFKSRRTKPSPGADYKILASYTHRRKLSEIVRGKYSCWFCCHVFIAINTHTPGRLVAPVVAGHKDPSLFAPEEGDGDRADGHEHQNGGGEGGEQDGFCTISSYRDNDKNSVFKVGVHYSDPGANTRGSFAGAIDFTISKRFWKVLSPSHYSWTIGFRRQADGSRRLQFKKDALSLRQSEEQLSNTQGLQSSQWLDSARLSLINGWLDDCMGGHSQCVRGLSPVRLRWLASQVKLDRNVRGYNSHDGEYVRTELNLATGQKHDSARSLPRRLVWIGGQEEDVKLVESSTLDAEVVEYATLSHCWGRVPFAVLTMENYSSYLEAIPKSDLTRTFTEAIALCRGLEIAYIWIDSLCIIQNSVNGQDWISEAPRMHLVYGNSLLTIAALSSKDGTAGVFRPPNHLTGRALRIKLPGWPVVGPALYSRQMGAYAHYEHDASILLRRAWCVQELYLSPRTVRWTDDQLSWHCNERACSEIPRKRPSFRDGDGEDVIEEINSYAEKSMRQAHWLGMRRVDVATSELWQVDQEWSQITKMFSNCNSTKQEDRYWALSSLAAYFHAVYNSKLSAAATAGAAATTTTTTYLAGIWEHHLPSALCWAKFVIRKSTDAAVLTGYAPSWSWLRVHGARYKKDPKTQTCAKVTRKELDYENTTQPFGPLRFASLDVEAFVFKVGLFSRMAMDANVRSNVCITGIFEAMNGSGLFWQPSEYDDVWIKLYFDDGNVNGFSPTYGAQNDAENFPAQPLPSHVLNQYYNRQEEQQIEKQQIVDDDDDDDSSSSKPLLPLLTCALMAIKCEEKQVIIDALVLKRKETGNHTSTREPAAAKDIEARTETGQGKETGTDVAGPVEIYERIGFLNIEVLEGRTGHSPQSLHAGLRAEAGTSHPSATGDGDEDAGAGGYDSAYELFRWFDQHMRATSSFVFV